MLQIIVCFPFLEMAAPISGENDCTIKIESLDKISTAPPPHLPLPPKYFHIIHHSLKSHSFYHHHFTILIPFLIGSRLRVNAVWWWNIPKNGKNNNDTIKDGFFCDALLRKNESKRNFYYPRVIRSRNTLNQTDQNRVVILFLVVCYHNVT